MKLEQIFLTTTTVCDYPYNIKSCENHTQNRFLILASIAYLLPNFKVK